MKKLNMALMLFALVIILAQSVEAVPTSDISIGEFGLEMSFPPFESGVYNRDLNFPFHVFNRYDGFPVDNGLTCCTFELYDSYGTSFYEQKSCLTDGGNGIYYPITAANFTYEGIYSFLINCNGTVLEHHVVAGVESQILVERGGFKAVSFALTDNGMPIDGHDSFLVFIWILFIVSSLAAFAVIILTIAKLVTVSETLYGIMCAWGSFLLILITHYIAKYYLVNSYIVDILGPLILPLGFTNVVIPLIGFVVTIFIKSTKKKDPITIEEIGGFRIKR